jgi:demethylmenaquinone methyltransferase/2-methoxy-6-polyprenyl-1,4-benzoquinol methylase
VAERVVAVDANAETLALNTEKAELVQADVFDVLWELQNQYFDVVFFSFWLSHVPVEGFASFWGIVGAALKPDGRVFLVDSGAGDTTHTASDLADGEETRMLADGRTFRILKRRWPPARLTALVRPLGFDLDLRDTANGHFIYGSGGPT